MSWTKKFTVGATFQLFVCVLLITTTFLMTGCAYLQDRTLDFVDMWKINGELGYGCNASVKLGELAHVGVGGYCGKQAGVTYATWDVCGRTEGNFPIGFMLGNSGFENSKLHYLECSYEGVEHDRSMREHCWGIPLLETDSRSAHPTTLHAFDIESEVFLPVFMPWSWMAYTSNDLKKEYANDGRLILLGVGLDVGFSPGEALDFITGIFGLDIANDDGEQRQKRKLYKASNDTHNWKPYK
jgi:hypothetical protein